MMEAMRVMIGFMREDLRQASELMQYLLEVDHKKVMAELMAACRMDLNARWETIHRRVLEW